MRVEASTVIGRQPEDVWRFVADEHCANHPRWDPSVTGLEPLSSGPMQLGHRFRLTRRTMGRIDVRDFDVVAWSPYRQFDIETQAPDMTLRLASQIEPVAEGCCRLTVSGDAQMRGLRGVLMPLFRRRVARDLVENLARIKTLVEQQGG
jgi:hypothetical protein